jgi:glycosyltransferase involved in cell wall biosynthesis
VIEIQNIKIMKKKILLLSDDLRMLSGVSTMSRELVMGTIHKFDWVQLGAAIKHPEYGKIFDLSEEVKKKTGVEDAYLRIVPYNGYGDIQILRKLIKSEKPDAILHFTDPHYWLWLYENEHEIRQQVPLLFYHVWDNLPDPVYNKSYYESVDWIGCISKQTYGIVKRVNERVEHSTQSSLEDWQISYVPHGINSTIFTPLKTVDDNIKKSIYGDKEYDFILFYNNRNIKRKQPSDVILSYKMFCDQLPKEKSKKCLLLMHTNPVDENGTDLPAVINELCVDYDVKFTNRQFDQETLNQVYNIVDCTINIANNEGFGLTTAESLMSGTPIIVNVTGGLQDQCGFNYTAENYINFKSLHDKRSHGSTLHGEWVVPVWSSSNNLNGSVFTPYIFDDRVNNYVVADAIMKMYELGRKKRKKVGLKGREFMIKNLSHKIMCEKLIEGIETTFKNWKHKQKYNLYKIV